MRLNRVGGQRRTDSSRVLIGTLDLCKQRCEGNLLGHFPVDNVNWFGKDWITRRPEFYVCCMSVIIFGTDCDAEP